MRIAMDGERPVGSGRVAAVEHARQRDGEGGALVGAGAVRGDRAAMALDHRLHDEEAEARVPLRRTSLPMR